ncbi:MAG: hypothetical protein U0636_10340 [Phycisphaerales bacterium]
MAARTTAQAGQWPQRGEGTSPWWLVLPAAALAVQAGVHILHGTDVGQWGWDQTQYHAKVIQEFASQWPHCDLVNYQSATSPGWHLLLAALLKMGASMQVLRWVNAATGVLLLLVATTTAARWARPRTAACLFMPLALSPYAVGGSAWITTDVPALLCMTVALAATTRAPVWKPRTAGIWATLAVAVRQPFAWLALPMVWRGMQDAGRSATADAQPRSLAVVFAWAALPILLLGVLVWQWHGLMPPAYRSLHDAGANPAGVVVLLALTACWGGPLAAILLWQAWRAKNHEQPWMDFTLRWAAAAAALALLYTLAIHTNYSKEDGRWAGPIWSLVNHAPTLGGTRSSVLLVLAPLGAATLAVLWRCALRRHLGQVAVLFMLSLACVAAANTANSQAWERYADLPLLVLLPWMASLCARTEREGFALSVASLCVAAVQVGIAMVTLWRPGFGGPGGLGDPS